MSQSPGSGRGPSAGRRGARRLTFSYEGDQVELVSEQSVDMTTPPHDEIEGPEERTGFLLELRDARDNVVYRKVMHNPIQPDVEAFSPDPAEPIHRRQVDTPQGTFVVLVPDLPEAEHVSLHSSPAQPGPPAARPLRELKRFRLRTREQ